MSLHLPHSRRLHGHYRVHSWAILTEKSHWWEPMNAVGKDSVSEPEGDAFWFIEIVTARIERHTVAT